MPRPRFANLDADKRARILDAATREFADKGFEAASFNQIIDDADISKGAMYYYFEDKLDLYLTVLREALDSMTRAVGGYATSGEIEGDFWAACEEMYRQSLRFALEHPELAALSQGLTRLEPGSYSDERIGEFYDAGREWTRELLVEGQAKGAVRDDVPLSLLVDVLFAMGEATDRWLLSRWEELAEEGMDEVVAMMMDMFRRVAEPEETDE